MGTPISAMTPLSDVVPGDVVPVVRGDENYKFDIGTALSIPNMLAAALGPYDDGIAVAPADTDIGVYQGLYIGSPGSVTLLLSAGGTVTYADCFAGQIIQASYTQVKAATTAANLLALRIVGTPVLPFFSNIVAASPADVNLAGGLANGLFVGSAGNVVVKMASGVNLTFANCPSSRMLPIAVTQVRAATTASAILALYP